jgi:hypothetical protein
MKARARRPASDPSSEVLTLSEAAKWARVEPNAFQLHVESGKIPGRKIGTEWRFSAVALERWLMAGDHNRYVAPVWSDEVARECEKELKRIRARRDADQHGQSSSEAA